MVEGIKGRKTNIKLGINTGFAINRFPEPEVWTRIVAEELGLRCVQFVADLLNPLLPQKIIDKQIERIQASAAKYGILIDTTFTGAFTRVNHLMHPDPELKEVWVHWFEDFFRISARLDARGSGSHFGILSVQDFNDPERRKAITRQAIEAWQRLSKLGAELGFQFLIFEPMSIPRENACTIRATEELLEMVNEKSAIPMKLCLDVDHGDPTSSDPDDNDPYAWLRRLGHLSPVIHIKQSRADKSGHWPFTEEYNESGIITPPRVIEAIEESGAGDVLLLLEISHRERHPAEYRVLDDLKASVDYWRPYVET